LRNYFPNAVSLVENEFEAATNKLRCSFVYLCYILYTFRGKYWHRISSGEFPSSFSKWKHSLGTYSFTDGTFIKILALKIYEYTLLVFLFVSNKLQNS